MTYEQIVEMTRKKLKKSSAKSIDENIAVQIDICGEGEGAFYIEVQNGNLKIEPYEYYDNNAKITISAKELKEIWNNKKSFREAVDDKTLYVEGDFDKLQKLSSLIKTETTEKKAKTNTAKKTKRAASKVKELVKSGQGSLKQQ